MTPEEWLAEALWRDQWDRTRPEEAGMSGTRVVGDCGHDMRQDGEWPGEGGTVICYGCFEVEADASWWESLDVLADTDHTEGET